MQVLPTLIRSSVVGRNGLEIASKEPGDEGDREYLSSEFELGLTELKVKLRLLVDMAE